MTEFAIDCECGETPDPLPSRLVARDWAEEHDERCDGDPTVEEVTE